MLLLAVLVDPDWPCAAISALMVCGEICATPLEPKVFGGAVGVEGAVVSTPNGELDGWAEPADCEDDDEVSDCSASNAEEIAPRAISMTNSLQTPPDSGLLGYRL